MVTELAIDIASSVVRVLGIWVECAKRIAMLLGGLTHAGPGHDVLDGGPDHTMGRGTIERKHVLAIVTYLCTSSLLSRHEQMLMTNEFAAMRAEG